MNLDWLQMDIGKVRRYPETLLPLIGESRRYSLKQSLIQQVAKPSQNMGTSELLSTPFALYDVRLEISGNNIYSSLTGNIGLGTTTPGDKLEISGAESTAGLRVRYGPTFGGLFGEFKHAGNGGLLINANAGGGWADMSFQTDGTTRMFIESAGNVGIGTTTPDNRLVIKSAGRVMCLRSSATSTARLSSSGIPVTIPALCIYMMVWVSTPYSFMGMAIALSVPGVWDWGQQVLRVRNCKLKVPQPTKEL